MNIVSTIMQMLAPVIINKIAASLGVNQGLAGKAIAAIVPAILAGLAGKAATSAGAARMVIPSLGPSLTICPMRVSERDRVKS